MDVTGLPEGYASRPHVRADAAAVCALVAEAEAHDDGVAEIDLSDIEADWRRPGFDLQTMSLGVFRGGELAASADVFAGRAEVSVKPGDRGRGIGTAIMRWTWDVARADGRDRVGQTVTDADLSAVGLFRSNGYEPTHTSWILQIEVPDAPPRPVLPEGLAFRPFVPGTDDRALYELIDTAFSEWPMRESEGFDNWRAQTLDRAEVRPELQVLIGDREGRIIAAAVNFDYPNGDEGWTQNLAVDAGYRRRGLGKALLIESFRRFHAAGQRTCGVSTDSRTGALGLYEAVGMHVRRSYTRWTKSL